MFNDFEIDFDFVAEAVSNEFVGVETKLDEEIKGKISQDVIKLVNTGTPKEIQATLKRLAESPMVSKYDLQLLMESLYSRKNINKMVRQEIEDCTQLKDHIKLCVKRINKWIDEDHYESKANSLNALRDFNIEEMLVSFMSIFMVQDQRYVELTKVIGQVLHFTPWDDYMEAAKRTCEIIVKMAECDLLDMNPAYVSATGTVSVVFKWFIDGETAKYIKRAKFLPPMVCKPKKIKRNRDSGYLTFNSHRITRKLQQHDEDICLDVLNLVNSTAYSLNEELLKRVEDEFSYDEEKDIDIEMQRKIWEEHQIDTWNTAIELINMGNEFFFEWFYDYRGRMYDRGHEIHLQGKSYKKAMLDFHEKREIEGFEQYADIF